MPKQPKAENFHFESSLNELNQIVEKMEQDDLELEESLKLFERGITLTRQCQKALQEAEQKVHILLEKEGQLKLAEYQLEDNQALKAQVENSEFDEDIPF